MSVVKHDRLKMHHLYLLSCIECGEAADDDGTNLVDQFGPAMTSFGF